MSLPESLQDYLDNTFGYSPENDYTLRLNKVDSDIEDLEGLTIEDALKIEEALRSYELYISQIANSP